MNHNLIQLDSFDIVHWLRLDDQKGNIHIGQVKKHKLFQVGKNHMLN